MHLVELVTVVAMLLVGVAFFAFRRRGQVADAPAEEPAYSLVRILTTDEELRDAALRAAHFDEIAAASAEARTRRYQLLAGPSPAPLHPLHPVLGSGDAGYPSSAA